MTTFSLTRESLDGTFAKLRESNAAFAARYPGESGRRQPVHTVYGGGHLFKAETPAKLGQLALKSLETFAPSAASFAQALGVSASPEIIERVHHRVVEKLGREPIEDFRIDFEDGYGNRPDAEEDGHAAQAASEVAKAMAAGTQPPFLGIRVKPFTEELHERSVRTLDAFVSTLWKQAGAVPSGFVVTLPKVTTPEQVALFAEVLGQLEASLSMPAGTLRCELMIETTQAIFDPDGRVNVPRLVAAAKGRCVATHFGTYDYTATCSITAAHQAMRHPACDFAKHVMQVSLGGTDVWLSDGATTVMPIPPHRPPAGGQLTAAQSAENAAAVHRAWKLAYDNVRHSLVHGYYQGWDLHPAQLPVRYAAVYTFFLEGLEPAAYRLANFVKQAAQATLHGDVFDDAATGQGLLNYFLRALACGALTEDEAISRTGLTLEEIRARSFVAILKNRRG
ncbi:MAG: phosphoenolpyruvate kinase [Deltaproteobacteria bacterium]|nr:phosphoenolpyruvate kinase [Deltaproteobacteria bacterium]